jgi:putative transposase
LNRYFLSVAYIVPNNGRVRFRGLAWTGPAVSYLASRRRGKNKQLRVLYDVSELGRAWVCDPAQPDQVYSVMAVEPEYQNGLTMHTHDLIKASLNTKKRGLNYRAAIEARVRILHEISDANSKRRRKARERSKEQAKPTAPLPRGIGQSETVTNTGSQGTGEYHLHPETPLSYQIVEAHDGPIRPK